MKKNYYAEDSLPEPHPFIARILIHALYATCIMILACVIFFIGPFITVNAASFGIAGLALWSFIRGLFN